MENQSKSAAIWVVIVVIILILIAFALYYLQPGAEIASPPSAGLSPTPPAEDSIAAVESDLEGLNVDGLDSELADIEKELAQ